jgi:hypothetical protein
MSNYTLALSDQLVNNTAPGSRMLILGKYLEDHNKRIEYFSLTNKQNHWL